MKAEDPQSRTLEVNLKSQGLSLVYWKMIPAIIFVMGHQSVNEL